MNEQPATARNSTADGAFRVRVPGRVNLIGDHTDYTGGLVMPMTIDRWTTIDGIRRSGPVEVTSDADDAPLSFTLPVADPARLDPAWGRFVAAVAAQMGTEAQPFAGRVTTTIPIGAGLSSSAALELASALALGFDGTAVDLARLGRQAEHEATEVPCGIMDQLSIAAGVANHALLIDCYTLSIDPVRIPADVDVVVQFVQHRQLAGSEYATRVAQCAVAEKLIGPLRTATMHDVDRIEDRVIHRRARHVVSENERVREFAEALRRGDVVPAGHLMLRSHASLRDDFETSTAAMDAAVASVASIPGVLGARMTGGGFGGCVVALVERGTMIQGWRVHAVAGAVDANLGSAPESSAPTPERP